MGGIQHLISQFADDTILFLKYEQISLTATLEVLALVETKIGLTISYDKTTIYRLGSAKSSTARLYTQKEMTWSDGDIETLGVTIINGVKQNTKQMDNVINKMGVVLDNWYLRKLTLMGKITVINSLVSSMLVYKMLVLPKMSVEQHRKLKEMMNKFIWKGRKPKIALNKLQCNKCHGGLGLVQFENKHIALMLTWVKKAALDTNFSYVNVILNAELGPLVWQLNLTKKDAMLYTEQLQTKSFWAEVWVEWSSVSYKKSVDTDDVWSEIVWLNSHVKIKNAVVFNSRAVKKGVVRVSDVINENGDGFMSYREICSKYGNVMNWLEYSCLLEAIPRDWKEKLGFVQRTSTVTTVLPWDSESHPYLELCDVCIPKPSKVVYKFLMTNNWKTVMLSTKKSIEKQLDQTLPWKDYQKMFNNIYKVTNCVKYRDFQYRFLLGNTYPNSILYHWGYSPDKLCIHCTSIETIKHLFWECDNVKVIWNNYKTFARKAIGNMELDLTYHDVALCQIQNKPTSILNLLAIIIKQYLYRSKCSGNRATWDDILREFNAVEKIERYIASSTNRLTKHIQKWAVVKGVMDENPL